MSSELGDIWRLFLMTGGEEEVHPFSSLLEENLFLKIPPNPSYFIILILLDYLDNPNWAILKIYLMRVEMRLTNCFQTSTLWILRMI